MDKGMGKALREDEMEKEKKREEGGKTVVCGPKVFGDKREKIKFV